MLKRILASVGLGNSEPTTVRPPEKPAPRVGAPIYPPVDPGVAFMDADEVLASQGELITRLRLGAGCDDQTFERLYGRVLRALADAINLLPASDVGTHNGAGGLFRLSLEIGFFSLQASEAAIFAARAGVETRRELEPRWRYATFLAGLCSELHRPITQMMVSTPSGELWPAFQLGLGEWLRSKGDHSYVVRWVTAAPGQRRPGQGATSYLAHKIIPAESLQYLHEGNIDIAPTLFDCIAGVRAGAYESSPLQKIVTQVREKVMARDEALKPQRYGKLRVGGHLEPHLLDAMRRLVTEGTWAINAKKARLWYSREGLFLVWKTAAKEILAVLEKDGTHGVPQDPQTLVELLTAASVFETDSNGSPYVTIRPSESGNDLIAVKFSDPLIILASLDDEPTPVATVFFKEEEPATTGATSEQGSVGEGEAAPAVANPHDAVAGSAPADDSQRGEAMKGDPAAASTPAPAVRPSSGGKKPVKTNKERDVGSYVPEGLAKAVTPLCRDVIGALIEDIRAGDAPVQAGKHPLGFAIGLEQVASYGVDATRFIEEVAKLGWLVPHPDKPNRKLHEAQIGGKQVSALVIQKAIAVDLSLL